MSEMSANGSVETEADAVLSSGFCSTPTGADTVAVLSSSVLDGYAPLTRSGGRTTWTSIVTGA